MSTWCIQCIGGGEWNSHHEIRAESRAKHSLQFGLKFAAAVEEQVESGVRIAEGDN